MDVKVKVIIKKPNFFALFLRPKLGHFKKVIIKKFHGFFYHWNMFFMGTNKNTNDVIAWDFFTLGMALLMIIVSIASFI